ncbi:MAG: hypothetical protein EP307_06360 [Rhodobacteraceae bacterium]|nr:MAG: hypothetical protein EP307_06360 [Paracoccaceae bacterium]
MQQLGGLHIRDEVLTPDGRLDIPRIKPIARLGNYDYTMFERTFEMRISEAHDALAGGLERHGSR